MDSQVLVPALSAGAFVHAELGNAGLGLRLLGEIEPAPFISSLPEAFFAAARLGVQEDWRERTRDTWRDTRFDAAADAVLDGRWSDAAVVYEEIGARPFAALASLHAAEGLVAKGRRAEADQELRRALTFFRSVGATRYIREGEALLAASA
jgi:hypothetical protein